MAKFLLTLIIGAFLVVTGLRCLPAYIERTALDKTIARMTASGETDSSALKQAFTKAAEISDIRSVSFSDLSINHRAQKLTIEYDYEARVPLFANVSLVFSFSNKE